MKDFWCFFRFVVLFGLAWSFFTGIIDIGFMTAHSAPKSPDISVQSFSISFSPNLSTVYYNVRLRIANPNQHDFINYKDFLVIFRLFSRDEKTDLMFSAIVPSFNQTARNINSVDLSFPRKVTSIGVGGGNSKKRRGESRSSGSGNVLSFRVKAMASICFGNVCRCKVLGDADLDACCETIEVARDAMLPGVPKKCKAGLSWI